MKRSFLPPRSAAQLPLCLQGEEGFEGPLDALLALLNGEPGRILQVSVAQLTEQYMAWLESAGERGLAQQVEFVETAVYLIRLKTDVLLHQWGGTSADEGVLEEGRRDREDPRQELQRQLEERQAEILRWRQGLRAAAERLSENSWGQATSLPRGQDGATEDKGHGNATELLVRIREARRAYALPPPQWEIVSNRWTEADWGSWLEAQLEAQPSLDFTEVLEGCGPGREEQCLLFSALLGGCKGGRWCVAQPEAFGPIKVALVSV